MIAIISFNRGVACKKYRFLVALGVGTFIVEFGALSRLTGDPRYENAAMRALDALWKARSSIDLVCIWITEKILNT